MKTAVSQMIKELQEQFPKEMGDMYERNQLLLEDIALRAKEMEKEQIMNAFDECGMWQDNYSDSEHYYNKTFKSE